MKKRLIIEDLEIKYSSGKGFTNCNIEAEEGDVVAIIGESGCGKSSLLNAIAGYMRPIDINRSILNIGAWFRLFSDLNMGFYKGKIYNEFEDNMSYLPQESLLYDNSTIYKNLVHNNTKNDTEISRVGIERELKNKYYIFNDLDDYVCDLSGGERQRVAIMRTMKSIDNGLYLLDEPFNGIDYINRKRIARQIFQGNIIKSSLYVLVSHDVHDVINIANKYFIFEKLGGIYTGKFYKTHEELINSKSLYVNNMIYGSNCIILSCGNKVEIITPSKIKIRKTPESGEHILTCKVLEVNNIYNEITVIIDIKNLSEYVSYYGYKLQDVRVDSNKEFIFTISNCVGLFINEECFVSMGLKF